MKDKWNEFAADFKNEAEFEEELEEERLDEEEIEMKHFKSD